MPTNPKIIQFIQRRIRDILADTTLLVKDNVGNGNYGIVHANGIEYFVDEGHPIGLIPKKITDKITFWLSVNIAINTSTDKLKDISIGVYFDDPKVKLFRAEWANNTSQIAHAQPHWHIHNEIIAAGNERWDVIEQKEFSIETEEEVENNFIFNVKDIHFAMYASWHRMENNHVEVLSQFNDNDIVNWTAGTLRYIIEQLIYLYNKKQLYN